MDHLGDIAQLITAIVLLLTFLQNWNYGRVLKKVAEQTDGINTRLVEAAAVAFQDGVKQGEENPK